MPTRLAASAAVAIAALTLSTAPARAGVTDQCSAAFFDGDARLGPAQLPKFGPVGFELAGYRRTGGETDQHFLAMYYSAGAWKYPPDNGYVVAAGKPVEWTQNLESGEDIDRFGSESGSFLSPQGLPYATRAIPPQSLDGKPAAGCDYHDYRVIKTFSVHAGPIAPWFAQPGGGLQYQLDATLVPGAPTPLNVMWLVSHGYLQRLI